MCICLMEGSYFRALRPRDGNRPLEAGIISGKQELIFYQEKHGGIHEYILGKGPCRDD